MVSDETMMFRFGTEDAFQITQEFQMGMPDFCIDHHVRLCHSAKPVHLAEVINPHFQNRDFMFPAD